VPTPPLTRYIGETERSLRALLDRLLRDSGLSFPAWTVLVTVDSSDGIGVGDLIEVALEVQVVRDGQPPRQRSTR
jgi:hypothetical protein